MKQILLIERVMDQTRMAVIEEGLLCELVYQRPDDENQSGNIYLGRVENVLPGMKAAFVNIGMEKNGFLAAGDIRLFAQSDRDLATLLGKARIEKLVRPGQELLVQVIRAQPGAKGPRLSCHITLPGRAMVLLSGVKYVGVSRKINSAGERARLREIGLSLTADRTDGIILRTAAQDMSEESLREEFARLSSQWDDMRRHSAHMKAPVRVYDDNDLALQAIRDRLTGDVEAIWTDDDRCYGRLKALAELFSPALADRIQKHTGETPLFDLYRVDSQADKALQRYVWLKSGGSLVIDETEALTVVDVNTGKNTGRRDADDTILATNCEAARELMRQLRLRDIGGMVVVDFIDMRRESDREALLSVLRECAANDRNRTRVVDYTALGLVELTRKRVRQSLSKQLTHTCSRCDGNGIVPSHETTARRALRDLWRRRRAGDETVLALEAAPAVCGWIRKIGMPEGGLLRLTPVETLGAGEYRFAPIDMKR